MVEIDTLRRGWQASERQLEQARAEVARMREALWMIIGSCQTGPGFSLSRPKRKFISIGQSALASAPSTAEWLEKRDQEIKANALEDICKDKNSGGLCRIALVDYDTWVGRDNDGVKYLGLPVPVLEASEVLAKAERIRRGKDI